MSKSPGVAKAYSVSSNGSAAFSPNLLEVAGAKFQAGPRMLSTFLGLLAPLGTAFVNGLQVALERKAAQPVVRKTIVAYPAPAVVYAAAPAPPPVVYAAAPPVAYVPVPAPTIPTAYGAPVPVPAPVPTVPTSYGAPAPPPPVYGAPPAVTPSTTVAAAADATDETLPSLRFGTT